MAEELIGGRYRLLEPLGRGAMSAVWLANDEELRRQVAVKLLAPRADRARFEREARAAAALSHPNLCGLYDYGEVDGRAFMVLEYLPNGSLEDRLSAGKPMPDDDSLRIATEIAAGLAHAHERGLVHRDLKPANVLFDAEWRAKIADFGIARLGDDGTLTEAGTVLGTASYISPEQASGLTAGPASDVYSFGVILFRMLTGQLPFVSSNAMELVRMHRDDPPPTVTDRRPDAPPRLAALVTAALTKDPAARPPNGAALLNALRGDKETTAATQIIPPARRASRASRLAPLAALAVLLVGGGVAVALVATRGDGSTPATTPPQSLSLPSVSTAGTTTPPATTHETTTAPTSTTTSTHEQTTTAETTTRETTTRATSTAPTSSSTTLPTTTASTTLPTTSETATLPTETTATAP